MHKLIRQTAFLFLIFIFSCSCSLAQENDKLELSLDVNSAAQATPKIYKPNMDLSGRGVHREISWPQELAAKEAIDAWQKDVGFKAVFRLQYNLWEIPQLAKDEEARKKLLANYESVIKSISDNGGRVILDLFGTPAGMGKVLDKNSPPQNLEAFKHMIKDTVRYLSCEKKYNIWYEVWNAPDLDDFFLGKRQEYFNLYRIVAEAVKELREETKIHIPLGGPSTSCWFQNLEYNTILTPERSLIYELIRYCYSSRLPLDFISWHNYSSDPLADEQGTIYKKPAVSLIREWLSYFHFDPKTPLIVDEWNFDRSSNIASGRQEKAYVAASYIPIRLKYMYKAGLDNQVYFCLEDFQADQEGLRRNLGVFSFDAERSVYKGSPKASYNVMRMLSLLGNQLLELKVRDDFVGAIATKSQDYCALLIYNYIDPDIAQNYLSRHVVDLNSSERKALLGMVNSDRLEKVLSGQTDLSSLRLSSKLRDMLKSALELQARAKKYSSLNRKLKISVKGYKEKYLYQRYAVDSACSLDCAFKPAEEKEVDFSKPLEEEMELPPYSVQLIILKKKPAQEPAPVAQPLPVPVASAPSPAAAQAGKPEPVVTEKDNAEAK